MPSSFLQTVPACPMPSLGWTSALFYSSSGVNTVRIPSRIPLSETMQIRRYVALETFLGPGRRVHECRIRVSNRKNVCFIIAVCFDPSYPTNEALRVVLPSSSWRAELFMFRCGTKKPVINLKKGDRHVGERGMIRFLALTKLRFEQGLPPPKSLTFLA